MMQNQNAFNMFQIKRWLTTLYFKHTKVIDLIIAQIKLLKLHY